MGDHQPYSRSSAHPPTRQGCCSYDPQTRTCPNCYKNTQGEGLCAKLLQKHTGGRLVCQTVTKTHWGKAGVHVQTIVERLQRGAHFTAKLQRVSRVTRMCCMLNIRVTRHTSRVTRHTSHTTHHTPHTTHHTPHIPHQHTCSNARSACSRPCATALALASSCDKVCATRNE